MCSRHTSTGSSRQLAGASVLGVLQQEDDNVRLSYWKAAALLKGIDNSLRAGLIRQLKQWINFKTAHLVLL